MIYNATSQRQILIYMTLLSVLVSTLTRDYTIVKWIALISFTMCFLLIFIKYTFILHNQALSYTIQLFGIPIFSKKLVPSDVKKIIFKRIIWNSKSATIELYKGFSIHVSFFKPESVYEDLLTFCEENAINYEKTKDYKIIEKMRKS